MWALCLGNEIYSILFYSILYWYLILFLAKNVVDQVSYFHHLASDIRPSLKCFKNLLWNQFCPESFVGCILFKLIFCYPAIQPTWLRSYFFVSTMVWTIWRFFLLPPPPFFFLNLCSIYRNSSHVGWLAG
jgi:hypothetical protein